MRGPSFSSGLREEFLELLRWRRDVRSFRSLPLPAETLDRLIRSASLSPSVGLSEPWRFVIVDDAGRRAAIKANFERANATALAAQEVSRQGQYAKLKLAGLDEAPAHVAVFADSDTEQGHALGRHTMPNTADFSVAIAVHTMWLAARLEGVGLGWVSILDPDAVAAVLDVPKDWRFIAYLCLGYPTESDTCPALERAGWERRRDPSSRIFRR